MEKRFLSTTDGERLRHLIKQCKRTLKDFCHDTRIAKDHLQKVITGKRPFTTQMEFSIASHLGMDPEDLRSQTSSNSVSFDLAGSEAMAKQLERLGEHRKCIATAVEIVNHARADPGGRCVDYAFMIGKQYRHLGEYEPALEWLNKALSFAYRPEDSDARADGHELFWKKQEIEYEKIFIEHFMTSGDFHQAELRIRHLRKQIDQFTSELQQQNKLNETQELKIETQRNHFLRFGAEAKRCQGRYRIARAQAERAFKNYDPIQSEYRAQTQVIWAECLRLLGRFNESEIMLKALEKSANIAENSRLLGSIYRAKVDLFRVACEREKLEDSLHAYLELDCAHSRRFHALHLLIFQALIELPGNPDGAREHISNAGKICNKNRKIRLEFDDAILRIALGDCDRMQGDFEAAAVHYEFALNYFRSIKCMWGECRSGIGWNIVGGPEFVAPPKAEGLDSELIKRFRNGMFQKNETLLDCIP